MTEPETHGPIDFVLLEFPGDRLPDKVAEQILSLLQRDLIRIWDIQIVVKGEDGIIEILELETAPDGRIGAFGSFSGARSGLFSDDDIENAAGALQPGTIAVAALFENSWAIPFVRAARQAEGDVIASVRIPAQDVIEVLDALEAIEH